MLEPAEHSARVAGGLIGLLIGNALAVPYDGLLPSMLPAPEQIQMPHELRSYLLRRRLRAGSYGEDGALTLMLLSTLLNLQRLDGREFLQRMHGWFHRGFYAADNLTFDVSLPIQRVVRRFDAGIPPERCGLGTDPYHPGAVARTVVLALLTPHFTDAELVAIAQQQAALTHNSPLGKVSSAFFALWVRAELARHPDGWKFAADTLAPLVTDDPDLHAAFHTQLRPGRLVIAGNTARVDELLHTVRTILMTDFSFPGSLRRIISLGNNSAGAAAVLGALVGIRYNLYGIPPLWRGLLREQNLITYMMHTMLERLDLPLVDI
jgi:ADP-ribosyl-[dinitrogen reductase] hydrolase